MKNQYEKIISQLAFYIAFFVVVLVIGLGLVVNDKTIDDNMPAFIIVTIMVGVAIYLFINSLNRKRSRIIKMDFPEEWKTTLSKHVDFYRQLSPEGKEKFENQVSFFLSEKKITGIGTEVSDLDRLLIASSAVIPVFGFDEWEYFTLDEVLLYPGSFDENYEVSKDKGILGMVGTGGPMDNVMILSKPALHHGFENPEDKKNVGIHEFIHLIDRASGSVDGIPPALANNQYMIPWLHLLRKKIEDIMDGHSDINPYGATNFQEFFAVVGEYFFERPELLNKKHPKLYKMLNDVFKLDMKSMIKYKFKQTTIGRNSPCPCGSGKKYKKCCMRKKKD